MAPTSVSATAAKSISLVFGATVNAPAMDASGNDGADRDGSAYYDHDDGGQGNVQPQTSTPITRSTTHAKMSSDDTLVRGMGSASVPRRITIPLSDEDELLYDMKLQNFSNEDVANRFREQGSTNYKNSSIESRWTRIRRVLQMHTEKLIDDGLTDWHSGEDEALLNAYNKADERITSELAKIRQSRWKYVAEELNRNVTQPHFSPKACEDRYSAIENGTARPPLELDDDPVARQRERQQDLVAHKKRKSDDADLASREGESKKNKKVKKASNRELAKDLKEEQKRKARESKEAQAVREQEKKEWRQRNIEIYRDNQKQEDEERRAADQLLKSLRKERDRKDKELAEEAAMSKADQQKALLLAQLAYPGATTSKPQLAAGNSGTVLAQPGPNKLSNASMFESDDEPAAPTRFAGPKRVHQAVSLDGIAAPPGEDPRGIMTVKELWPLLTERGLSLERRKQVKAVVLSRLRASDQTLSVGGLKKLLHARKQPVSGASKAVLVRRLALADAVQSKSWSSKQAARFAAANATLRPPPQNARRSTGSHIHSSTNMVFADLFAPSPAISNGVPMDDPALFADAGAYNDNIGAEYGGGSLPSADQGTQEDIINDLLFEPSNSDVP